MIISEHLNTVYEEIIMKIDNDMMKNKNIFEIFPLGNSYTASQNMEFQQTTKEQIREGLFRTHILAALEAKLKSLDLDNLVTIHNDIDIVEKIKRLLASMHIEPDAINHAKAPTPPKETINEVKKSNVKFKVLYELFIKEKLSENPNIAKSTLRDYESAYEDFIFVVSGAPDRDITGFTKEDFREFLNALHDYLPTSRTKKGEFKKLSYQQLKAITLDASQKMSHNTKQKKMNIIKQIFDLAIDARYGYLEENLVEPFIIKNSKNKKQKGIKRAPLSDENLTKLFNMPIFTTKRDYILKFQPEKYWIPIISLFTGMRQNEICQLYCEDIKYEIISTGEKVYYFDINNDRDKSLKNINAKRKVPIHPKLIELGFIKYIDKIKSKHQRVFPNLRLHPTEKKYNTDYSKNFMKYFRKYVTAEKTQVFHSIRHNVSTQLLNNAVKHKIPKDLINRLMGHEPAKDETSQSYFSGYDIEALYEGVRTLDFILYNNINQKGLSF